MESDMKEHLARTPRLVRVESFVNNRSREVASLSDAVKSSEHLRWGGLGRKRRALRSYTRKQYGRTYLNKEPSQTRPSKSRLKRLRKRKAETMQKTIDASCCKMPFGFGGQNQEGSPRMLETYRWHVKRYKILERWNHRLPVHFNGKGHASMGFLEKISKGCIAHDASYWCAFHLCGLVTDIAAGLNAVSSPSCIAKWTENAQGGAIETVIPIHKRNSWPNGLIAPAKIMWVPCSTQSISQLRRRLLVWVHCSAFREVVEEMVESFEKSDMECKVEPAPNLRRIEVCGLRSVEVFKKVLMETEGSTGAWVQALGNIDRLHDGQAFTLLARDPRLARPLKMDGVDRPTGGTVGKEVIPLNPGFTVEENDAWTDLDKGIGEMAFPHPHTTKHVSQLRNALGRSSMGLASDSIERKLQEGSRNSIGQKSCEATKCYATPVVVVFRKISGMPCWSLVVPSGWALPFWKEIMLSGGFAAGLWEWRWLMSKQGLLTFPFDFPDSQAYMRTQMELNEVQNEERAKRAKAKRQPPRPFPPPWTDVAYWAPASPEIEKNVDGSREEAASKKHEINSSEDKHISADILASTQCLGNSASVEYCRDDLNLASCGGESFLPFRVEMLGKGVCDEGASIFAATSGSEESGVGKLLGFVTTSFPRGVKPFPGGFAICRTSISGENRMVVWLKNPKSTKLRKACLALQRRDHWNDVIL